MSTKDEFTAGLRQHYIQGDLIGRILEALKKAGKDIDRLTPEDLAPVDEFHTLGRQATLSLAKLLELTPGIHVLDVGSGLGGPSRCLAAGYGCRVTGVDLMDEYCAAAGTLAQLVGLSERVEYRRGDALHLPFADAAFDVVWTQHTAMNIEDKAAFYRELYRILKPDGRLAIFDVLSFPEADSGPLDYPVPWARTPETSFLVTAEELKRLLSESGFSVTVWEDLTSAALDAFTKLEQRVRKGGLPPLGTHVLLGPDFASMLANQLRNFQENRIRVVQIVAGKTS